MEGAQVWDLAGRMSGQIRAIPGAVLGWDMSAGLALGAALGIAPMAVAELLPVIEAEWVRQMNLQISGRRTHDDQEALGPTGGGKWSTGAR